jgi:hypothetical protein
MEMQASGKGAVVQDPVEALVQVVASVTFNLRIQDGRPIASAQVHLPPTHLPRSSPNLYTHIHICTNVHIYTHTATHSHTHTHSHTLSHTHAS